MPSPPPKGRSSTVRWRSWVKARRSWVCAEAMPSRKARETTPKSSTHGCVDGPRKKSGKMVTMSKRIKAEGRGVERSEG